MLESNTKAVLLCWNPAVNQCYSPFVCLLFQLSLSQWEFFPAEIRVTFPEESQLRQSRATQPELTWCMQYFCVTIPPAVRPTLLRQMDMGSLTCAQNWVLAVHTKGGPGACKQATELDSEG